MVIASVKVFLLFLIVDIRSNCQTIIIDNYTKNRGNFFDAFCGTGITVKALSRRIN
jgi:hypothetical protein